MFLSSVSSILRAIDELTLNRAQAWKTRPCSISIKKWDCAKRPYQFLFTTLLTITNNNAEVPALTVGASFFAVNVVPSLAAFWISSCKPGPSPSPLQCTSIPWKNTDQTLTSGIIKISYERGAFSCLYANAFTKGDQFQFPHFFLRPWPNCLPETATDSEHTLQIWNFKRFTCAVAYLGFHKGGPNFRWPLVLTWRGAKPCFPIFSYGEIYLTKGGPWPNASLNTPLYMCQHNEWHH